MPASLCPYAQQRIGERVGSGAYGIAYRLQVGSREYIVKEQPLVDDEGLLLEAVMEAVMLASINHPNIIPVYDICMRGTRLQIIEEAGGETLRSWFDRLHSEGDLTLLATQVDCAVRFLHSHSIYHNDISLNNILVTDEGRLYIIDFGLATIYESNNSNDFEWQAYLGSPERSAECPRGEIRRAPAIRSTNDYQSLYLALYQQVGGEHFYNHAMRLLAATRLPDTRETFTAACYLVHILDTSIPLTVVAPFATVSGMLSSDIINVSLQLADDLGWRLL